MHACATSARALNADLRRRYWAIKRVAVIVTSSAALASTAPRGCPEKPAAMIRTSKMIKLAENVRDQQDDQGGERPRSSSASSVLNADLRDKCRRVRGEPTAENSRRRASHCQPGGQHRTAETNHDHDQRSSIRSSWRLPGPSTVPPSGRKWTARSL